MSCGWNTATPLSLCALSSLVPGHECNRVGVLHVNIACMWWRGGEQGTCVMSLTFAVS